jgi:hypothetical protein
MRLFDWVSLRSVIPGQGAEDSRRAMSRMRHTLCGNRIAPPGSCEQGEGQPSVLLIHGSCMALVDAWPADLVGQILSAPSLTDLPIVTTAAH